MSENKTLEEEIKEELKEMLNDGIPGTFEPSKYGNKKIAIAVASIFSLVVARMPKEKIAYKTLAVEGGKEWTTGYNQAIADCIQAIREKKWVNF